MPGVAYDVEVWVHALLTPLLLAALAASLVGLRDPEPAAKVLFALCFLTIAQWALFRNECLPAVWEKRQLDPAYRLGDCPVVQPSSHVLPHHRCRAEEPNASEGWAPLLVALLLLGVGIRRTWSVRTRAALAAATLAAWLVSFRAPPRAPAAYCAALNRRAAARFCTAQRHPAV